MSTIHEIISEEVDIDELLQSLQIVEEDVLDAALNQPKYFIRASRLRVQMMRKRMKAARIMDQVRSSVGLRHRQIKENGKARTEGMINSLVDADPDYERARAAFETAQTFEEFSKQILEAFRYRRDAIRIIVDQMQSELGDKYKEANKIAAMEQNQNLSQAARRKYTRLKNADDTDEDSEY